MFKQNGILLLVLVCLLAGVGAVSAASLDADLEVDFRGQNNPFVYSPYTYRVRVNNTGGANADNVQLKIDLPLTDTSPNKQIMGVISGIDNKCQLVANKLECDLGRIRNGRGKTVKFNFEFPVSTKTLEMKATVTTSSNESNTSNNIDTKTPNFRYPSNSITSADVLNSHCTGHGLTSFYECLISPTSVTTHNTTLESNGTISFDQPGYTGAWYQPSPNQLHFTYSDGNGVVLTFNGFATSATCFEGLSTFPNSQWVSPYKVCVQ